MYSYKMNIVKAVIVTGLLTNVCASPVQKRSPEVVIPATTTRTIKDPCPVPSQHATDFDTWKREINLMLTSLNYLKSASQTGLDSLVEENVLSNAYQTMLLRFNLAGLPPQPFHMNLTKENMATRFTQDYWDVSIFTIFVSTSLKEEQIQTVGAMPDDLLEADLLKTRHRLYDVLCRLNILLQKQKSELEDFATDNEMPDYWKDLNHSKERYARAFLLFHRIKSFSGSLWTLYHDYYQTLITDTKI